MSIIMFYSYLNNNKEGFINMLSPYDNEQQISASELLAVMRKDMPVYIGTELYELSEITDKLIATELRIAAEESITDNSSAIDELYIKTIKGLMDE